MARKKKKSREFTGFLFPLDFQNDFTFIPSSGVLTDLVTSCLVTTCYFVTIFYLECKENKEGCGYMTWFSCHSALISKTVLGPSSQALSHQEVLDPKCQPQRLGSLAVWQTAWKVNSARVNAYVMNSLQRTCFTVPEMCYMGRTNFKSLWIVGEKCLVQGVTGIRFLSDPFELLDFLSAAFKWCLGINWANMRHRLLLWKQRGNSDYLVFWVKESYIDILILEI